MFISLAKTDQKSVVKDAFVHYAEKILGQEYGSLGFWMALALVLVFIPLLGRLAARHFFGKEGSYVGIGLTGILSVGLTYVAICMADTSLVGIVPKSVEMLVISLCAGFMILLLTSASAQVLSMGFGPSLGLQLVFWNIVFFAQLTARFAMDFFKHI